MKTIRFIRHAESEANAGLPSYDPVAIPLTESGRIAATESAVMYGRPPELIVVSPYLRARQTAEPFIALFSEAKVEEWPIHEFTYISPARCRGSTATGRRPMVEEYWRLASPTYVDGQGAESFLHFIRRVQATLNELRDRRERTILAVGHGLFIKAAKFFQSHAIKPSDPDSMRMFWEYSEKHPVPNLGTWDVPRGGNEHAV
jgi:broad specificity phosphatase PhoE